MTKQLENGLEVFDGHTVKAYSGRFNGVFDIDAELGLKTSTDDLVSFVVTARVGNSKLVRNTQTGEMTRVNTLRIEDSVGMEQAQAAWVYSRLGALVHGVNDGLIEDGDDDDIDDEDQLSLFVRDEEEVVLERVDV